MSEKAFNPLKKFLEDNKESTAAFARKCNLSKGTISHIANDKVKASYRTAKKLVKYSGGKLKLEDFGYE